MANGPSEATGPHHCDRAGTERDTTGKTLPW
jgi:hypothetical protein